MDIDVRGGMERGAYFLTSTPPAPGRAPPIPRIACWVATAVVVALAAVSSVAWYVAAAEERGLYHQPWHKPASVLWHLSLVSEAWWFAPLLYFCGGAAVALWAVTPMLRRPASPSNDAEQLRVSGTASDRRAVVDAFVGFLESHMRPVVARGQTLLDDLPAMIEVGTAEQELQAYAKTAKCDFDDLQRLTRLYRPVHGDLTDIVAATMEFNYFEVVTAARDLANVLAREPRPNLVRAPTSHGSYAERRQTLDDAIRRLATWVETRLRVLATQRGTTVGQNDDPPLTWPSSSRNRPAQEQRKAVSA